MALALSYDITSEQKRAAAGWQASESPIKDFVTLCKSAPSLIMASGLMATLAFLKGKAKDDTAKPHGKLCDILCAWIERRQTTGGSGYEAVQTALLKTKPAEYRLLTEEVQSLLAWLRHFAAARSEGKEGQ